MSRLLIALLFLSIVACGPEETNNILVSDVTFESDSESPRDWKNLKAYEGVLDYMRNLDYELLEADSLGDRTDLLMKILQLGVEASGDTVIRYLKQALDTSTKADKIQFYQAMLREFMNNEERHQEAVDLLDLPPNDINAVLATFPPQELEQLDEPVSSTLHRVENFGQPQAAVQVNGDSLLMWLDTGAELSVMSVSKARKYGVVQNSGSERNIGTVTSIEVKAGLGYIPELKVGNVLIRNHPVLIMQDKDLIIDFDSMHLDLTAILGWPAIRHTRLTLDDKHKKYEAVIPDKTASDNNFFWFGYAALKLVAEDGQSLIFGLDTGLDETELKPNIFKKQEFAKVSEDSVGVGGAGGIERRLVQVVHNLSVYLADHKVTFSRADVAPNIDFFFINQDGTIGANILNNNKVVLDFPNRQFKVVTDE